MKKEVKCSISYYQHTESIKCLVSIVVKHIHGPKFHTMFLELFRFAISRDNVAFALEST